MVVHGAEKTKCRPMFKWHFVQINAHWFALQFCFIILVRVVSPSLWKPILIDDKFGDLIQCSLWFPNNLWCFIFVKVHLDKMVLFFLLFFLLIQIYIWNSCVCSEEARKISVFTLYRLREIDWFSNRLGQKLLRCSTEQTETCFWPWLDGQAQNWTQDILLIVLDPVGMLMKASKNL